MRWLALPVGVLGLSAMVATGTGHGAPAPVTLGGGSGLIVAKDSQHLGPVTVTGDYACSLTTIGHDRGGRLIGLTAGHCGPAGTTVLAEQSRGAGVVGTIVSSTGKSLGDNEGLDYAVIKFDPAKVVPVRTVGATTITAIGTLPAPGVTVCHNGRTSGSSCGAVLGSIKDVVDKLTAGLPGGAAEWDGDFPPELGARILDRAVAAPGDSGGPVTDGDRLIGMEEGVITPPLIPPEIPLHIATVFVPIDRILARITASGGIGAGFTPV